MPQNEPIIFKIFNPADETRQFRLPFYWSVLNDKSKKTDIYYMDVKVNTEWHKKVLPYELFFDMSPKKSYTILVKPHNDNYFAGWGDWYSWSGSLNTDLLTAVLSDPDYAHLENGTDLGEYFRRLQYQGCENLTIAPTEIYEKMLKKNGMDLEFVPPKLRTVPVCEIALKADWRALEFVPKDLRNRSFCNESLGVLEFTNDFREAFNLMENSNKSLFITGKAGTGKSTLIEYFRVKTQKKAIFLAPTGVAALNVRGKTIHSLFKFPHTIITSDIIKTAKYSIQTKQVLKSADIIVVDEISMVRADLVEGMDYVLKKIRKNDEPFGGAQMVFVGDMYQLPPVVNNKEKVSISYNGETVFEGNMSHYFERKYKGCYFFNSQAFMNSDFNCLSLNTVFRQKNDVNFMNILNSIRDKKITEELLRQLNARYFPEIGESGDKEIVLGATNGIVNDINRRKMDALKTKELQYSAQLSGVFLDTMNEKDFPAEKNLVLKEGAQIMMVKNDPDRHWVNGTIGIIKTLSENSITVDIDGAIFVVLPATWEAIDYEYDAQSDKLNTRVIGTYTQFPVKLAWAITIHKSQGKTFDKVIIDLGNGAFAHGQTYVALSRCKTLDGIRLKQAIKRKDIILDEKVVSFMVGITRKNHRKY
jgi:GTPase SAR1 family protein